MSTVFGPARLGKHPFESQIIEWDKIIEEAIKFKCQCDSNFVSEDEIKIEKAGLLLGMEVVITLKYKSSGKLEETEKAMLKRDKG